MSKNYTTPESHGKYNTGQPLVRIRADVFERLQAYTKSHERSLVSVASEAVGKWLDEHEKTSRNT